MPEKRLVLDQDILTSFLTGLPQDQANRACNLFAKASEENVQLVVYPMTVAAVIHQLETVHQIASHDIAETLIALLQGRNMAVKDEDIVLKALELYRDKEMAFDQAYLAASLKNGTAAVASFNPAAYSMKSVKHYDPPR